MPEAIIAKSSIELSWRELDEAAEWVVLKHFSPGSLLSLTRCFLAHFSLLTARCLGGEILHMLNFAGNFFSVLPNPLLNINLF